MTASKLGMSIATVVLLAGVVVGQAQQAQQTQQAQKVPAAASTANATNTNNAAGTANAANATSAASAATSSAGSAAAAASGAKSSADAQDSDPGLTVAQLKEARDDGFKPVTRGSATLYCKSEIMIGSAFPMHICYNADRLKIVMQQQEAQRMQMEQMHGSGLQGH